MNGFQSNDLLGESEGYESVQETTAKPPCHGQQKTATFAHLNHIGYLSRCELFEVHLISSMEAAVFGPYYFIQPFKTAIRCKEKLTTIRDLKYTSLRLTIGIS